MTENEAIDKVLTFLYDKEYPENIEQYYHIVGLPSSGFIHLHKKIISEGFASSARNSEVHMLIEPRGRAMVEYGGYVKYLEDQEIERKEQKRRDAIELTLAESNIEANRLQDKWSSRNWIATLINLLLGVINIGILIYGLSK